MTNYTIQGQVFDIDLSKWRTREQPITKEEIEEFIKANPILSNWSRRKRSKAYPRHLKVYCDLVGLTPQDLLNLKSQYGSTVAEELLELVQDLLTEEHGVKFKGKTFGISQVFNLTTSVKSFYAYNGRSLAKGRGTYHYKKVHEKPKFTKEDLIPFSDGMSLQFQTWVAFLSSFPPRIETFRLLDWSHVKEALDESIPLPHITVEPELLKKKLMELGVEEHGFLHSWARKKLLEWRKEYERLTGEKIDLSKPETLDKPLWISTKGNVGERISADGIERHFRIRSRKFGKRIYPHSFRAFFKSNIRTGEDEKAVFLGQSGKHNRAYSMELVERLREDFKEATKNLNPLYTDRYQRSKTIVEQKFGDALKGIPQAQKEKIIEVASEQLALGLMKIQEQNDKNIAVLLSNMGHQLRELRSSIVTRKETKIPEEKDFPFTKKSWKGIHKEGDEP